MWGGNFIDPIEGNFNSSRPQAGQNFFSPLIPFLEAVADYFYYFLNIFDH